MDESLRKSQHLFTSHERNVASSPHLLHPPQVIHKRSRSHQRRREQLVDELLYGKCSGVVGGEVPADLEDGGEELRTGRMRANNGAVWVKRWVLYFSSPNLPHLV